MNVLLLALFIGIIAGLRAMLAPAAVAWAARLGWLGPGGPWLGFLGAAWTPWVLSALALAELVGDQLPSTPSRTVPVLFATRTVTGALAGAAIGAGSGQIGGGALAGIAGAILGTLGGKAFRARLAKSFGRDAPAAFTEDAIAIAGAVLVVLALR